MTRAEHLLTKLLEECCEVGQRCTKAMRFGLQEIQDGHNEDNAARIMDEFLDVVAIVEVLQSEGHLPLMANTSQLIRAKKDRFFKFYAYSIECGTVTPQ